MSPGKLAAQAVHAALALGTMEQLDPMMSVVVLQVNEAPFQAAKIGKQHLATVQDAGLTEVPRGTETVIAFLEEE